ncbi:FMN-binding negative transcriptional regulator [Planosporangium thailandense]|uniref:FMN-binding negative transcriptional regulator n=1 Tax=Planosporangium thailandense TaxID=765197 RepID=A0ABX0XU45_9ACTN|nr:FMN-binding negative transcriptional regulator [Planosporangium thailandense]NJC68814.1 FMN-binding negative transcriptional regulator [Planosporangium thailandense]
MYVPQHFQAPDSAAVHQLLTSGIPGELVTWDGQGMVATTVPLLFEASAGTQGRLIGHLARNNVQWRHTDDRVEALVIFRGPDAYVSPTAYASKHEHGRAVPTWNYITAHIYGTLVAHEDPTWTERAVRDLTDRHEADRVHPWSVDDAPAAYIAGQLRAIVGIEVVITRIEAKWKLSQNRSPADIAGVRDDLLSSGRGSENERRIAAEMGRISTLPE